MDLDNDTSQPELYVDVFVDIWPLLNYNENFSSESPGNNTSSSVKHSPHLNYNESFSTESPGNNTSSSVKHSPHLNYNESFSTESTGNSTTAMVTLSPQFNYNESVSTESPGNSTTAMVTLSPQFNYNESVSTEFPDNSTTAIMTLSPQYNYNESVSTEFPDNSTAAMVTYFKVPTETSCQVSIITESGDVMMSFIDGHLDEWSGPSIQSVISNKDGVFVIYSSAVHKLNFLCQCLNETYNCSGIFEIVLFVVNVSTIIMYDWNIHVTSIWVPLKICILTYSACNLSNTLNKRIADCCNNIS